MNKSEMNLILKKIRGECGLGEPTKLTYYRNTAGKVVFKAWFDELITPQDLIDTDRELSSSKLNKFHSQFHDEDELEYKDDFAIVDFNLHKGWVKFIPNDQDYNYVESVRDIQKNKLNEEKLTLTKGKLLTNIGSIPHPMTKDHYIEWVALVTNKGNQRKSLKPGDAPNVVFMLDEDECVEEILAYCNIHSLWGVKVNER